MERRAFSPSSVSRMSNLPRNCARQSGGAFSVLSGARRGGRPYLEQVAVERVEPRPDHVGGGHPDLALAVAEAGPDELLALAAGDRVERAARVFERERRQVGVAPELGRDVARAREERRERVGREGRREQGRLAHVAVGGEGWEGERQRRASWSSEGEDEQTHGDASVAISSSRTSTGSSVSLSSPSSSPSRNAPRPRTA